MSQHKPFFSFLMVSIFVWLVIILGGCTTGANETDTTPVSTTTLEAPANVVAAREAVLDYLRDGANECVPPAGIRWRATPGSAPEGFSVYRFKAEDCLMTVSYALDEGDDTQFHVTLGDKVTGFCWQATVNASGHVQDTGLESEMRAELINAAAAYCTEQGYQYEMRTQPDGRQCGVCAFPDASACNAWAFFQNECQPGDIPASTQTIQE